MKINFKKYKGFYLESTEFGEAHTEMIIDKIYSHEDNNIEKLIGQHICYKILDTLVDNYNPSKVKYTYNDKTSTYIYDDIQVEAMMGTGLIHIIIQNELQCSYTVVDVDKEDEFTIDLSLFDKTTCVC